MNVKKFLKLFLLEMFALSFSCVSFADDFIVIREQGNFSAGGVTIQAPGEYVSQNFDNWKPYPAGQTLRADHASVFYQIPADAKSHAIVFLHGAFGSGRCWSTTPDGRDGFANIFLKRGYPVYLIDQPRSGQAGRSSIDGAISANPDEAMWFEIWRMGHWPDFFDGVQFPTDEESINQFFRCMTPDTGAYNDELSAKTTAQVFERSGHGILVTHSRGGLPGFLAPMHTDKIKAIAAYEPGAYPFPDGEVPEPMPSRTGTVSGVSVPVEEFMKLTRIPIVIYFGDYIPSEDDITDDLGTENWRVRLAMGRKFVECVNKHGGDAEVVSLPDLGIKGNTHFLFAEKNNVELADLLSEWLKSKGL